MTTSLKQAGFTQEAFDAFLADRDEPDWLVARRREAWQAFQEMPLPSRADEEWMRTDIRLFRSDRFSIPVPASGGVLDEPLPTALLAHGVQLGGRTETYDSVPLLVAGGAELNSKWAQDGVLLGSLDELVRKHGELIKKHLFRAV